MQSTMSSSRIGGGLRVVELAAASHILIGELVGVSKHHHNISLNRYYLLFVESIVDI